MLRCLAVLLCLAAALPVAAADLAGEVIRLQGIAVASLGERARQLDTGDDLYVGEKVTTGADTRLRMRLIEGAVITLGDNSTFTFVGYREESEGPVLDFLRGVFQATTSDVGEARGLKIDTRLAGMGVRGTTFWASVEPDHVAVALFAGGGVWVEAAGEQVVLAEPGTGTDVRPGAPPTPPKAWGAPRLEAASEAVAFD